MTATQAKLAKKIRNLRSMIARRECQMGKWSGEAVAVFPESVPAGAIVHLDRELARLRDQLDRAERRRNDSRTR